MLHLNTVRAMRRWTASKVLDQVDCGRLLWVWDMSAVQNGHRELRFWAREVAKPELCAGLNLPEAINSILGGKRIFRPKEIEIEWDISHQTILRLRQSGDFQGGKGILTRESLAEFLRTRWIGNL